MIENLPYMKMPPKHVPDSTTNVSGKYPVRYKAGDVVTAKHDIVEAATGDHPAFHMASKGQKLDIIEADPQYALQYIVRDLEKRWPQFQVSDHELI